MSILKKPYELSLWEDEVVTASLEVGDWSGPTTQGSGVSYSTSLINNSDIDLNYNLIFPGYALNADIWWVNGSITFTDGSIIDIPYISLSTYSEPTSVRGIIFNTATHSVYGCDGNGNILTDYDFTSLIEGQLPAAPRGSTSLTLYIGGLGPRTLNPLISSAPTSYYQEFKALVLGADTMASPDRALDVKFTCDINGTHQLSFKMYYQYYDTQTGELIHNLLADQIVNESKIKLHYEDQWYDLVIKNIVKNSNDYSLTYTAQDLFINELSKTGFNLEFADEIGNNMDSARGLVAKVLEETDWTLNPNSDIIAQTQKEMVFKGTLNRSLSDLVVLTKLDNGAVTEEAAASLPSNTNVYIFYSDCSSKNPEYQFLVVDSSIETDSNHVILNGIQYRYHGDPDSIIWVATDYGVSYPNVLNNFQLTNYQGEKYIFSQEIVLDLKLKKILSKYTKEEGGVEKTYWGFTETDYSSPALIRNYAANPTNYEGTAGWRGGKTGGTSATLELDSIPSLIDKFRTGTAIGQNTSYTPVLKVSFPTALQSIVLNSGIRDNAFSIKELANGDQFVFYYHITDAAGNYISTENLTVDIQEVSNYTNDTYTLESSILNGSVSLEGTEISQSDYRYTIVQVDTSIPYDDFKKGNYQIVLRSNINDSTFYYIQDFQVFKYVNIEGIENGRPMLPTDTDVEAVISTKYIYFPDGTEYSKIEDLEGMERYLEPQSEYVPAMRYGCEKVRSINAKESNRFNIIQDICETFECWASFDIEHDSIGRSGAKYVTIHQYIGQDNPARFLNGVNLKTTSRTFDSNQLVTKLIVKSNSNQYADGGFCTIATADANPSGETTIFNFDYFINQWLLDPEALTHDLYDISGNWLGYYTNLKNINTQLIPINKELSDLAVVIPQIEARLQKAEAGKLAAEEGLKDTNETLERHWFCNITSLRNYIPTLFTKLNNPQSVPQDSNYFTFPEESENNWHRNRSDQDIFYCTSSDGGHTWTNPTAIGNTFTYDEKAQDVYKRLHNGSLTPGSQDYSPEDLTLVEWVTKGIEYERNKELFDAEVVSTQTLYDSYTTRKTKLIEDQEDLIEQKRILNLKFNTRYARFIQEGTWIDEKYVDDDLYFYDARSIGYESAMPKVTYQMNVIDVSVLPEYKGYTFKIGDRTYIQDPEFFGYTVINNIKTPAKEEVTVNKIVYSLDNPSATQITIQTYKNLFQDLFQRITATVQQVHYATGSYEKAAALAEAETMQKVEFLQDALNDAATILSNDAEQTVTWDNTGITITDGNNSSQKLRLVSGGILLGVPNERNETEWKVGITAKGMSANKLTSGQLDTGLVQIMSGKQPTFRWDALGLTAYDFDVTQVGETKVVSNVVDSQGVRFDRLGIYGFAGVAGASWSPDKISAWTTYGQIDTSDTTAISAFSTFSLTKEGLYLKLGGLQYGHYYNSNIFPGTFSTPKSHNIKAWLGKGEDILYNSWVYQNNIKLRPYYDYSDQTKPEFVKIFAVYNNSSMETVSIYDDGTFKATDAIIQGNITATSGSFTGSITANSGHIGGVNGWIIEANKLYGSYVDDNNRIKYMGLYRSATKGDAAFYAGATSSTGGSESGGSAVFKVTNDGKLTATGADITGKLSVALTHYHEYAQLGMWKVGNPLGNNESSTQDNRGSFDRYFFTEASRNGSTYIMGMQNPSDGGQVALTIGATDWEHWKTGKFYVDFYGKTTTTEATIDDATITSGTIAQATIEDAVVTNALITDGVITNGKADNITLAELKAFVDGSAQGNEHFYFSDFTLTYKYGTTYTITCTYYTQAPEILTSPLKIFLMLYNSSGQTFSIDVTFPVGLYVDDTHRTYTWTKSAGRADYTNLMLMTSSPQRPNGEPLPSYISVTGSLIPTSNPTSSSGTYIGGYDLGSNTQYWNHLYTRNPPNSTSDRRLKQNISLLSSSYDSFFDALRPSTYQWLNESITHTGFIAQEVADALAAAHLSPSDFYGYRDENPDSLGLAYSEFISLNTWQIQKLKKRVADLEARCSLLEQKLLN